jgi:putative solute:sodium symporter small subunit
VVTFVVGYFARDLNFTFFGWPFSFWMGPRVAGRLLPDHLVLRPHMNKLDQEHGVPRRNDMAGLSLVP